MRRRGSLVGALVRRIGLLFAILVLIAAVVISQTARDQIDEAYDSQLIISANVLQALVGDEVREQLQSGGTNDVQTEVSIDDSLLSQSDREAFNQSADWRMFRIWSGDRVVMRSDTGPKAIPGAPFPAGFQDVIVEGFKWRIYTLRLKDEPDIVEVGERLVVRGQLVHAISLELVLPLLLLIPATVLLLWLAVNDGLRVFRALVKEIGRRSASDLTPLPAENWPRDVRPLVKSVNQLLGRIGRSLQHERRFVDQAAHQLRTPLSVVKLQAQMIAREERPKERSELVAQLASGVDRASLLVDRLLTLARLDSSAEAGGLADLAAEATAAIADLAPLAAAREVSLSFDCGGPAPVAADPQLLRMICANLIDNAIRYSAAGGEVQVDIRQAPGEQRLCVTDAGRGIPPEERAQVVERFNRGRNPDGEGTGLGLSIVSEALRLLGGDLQLSDRPDGQQGLVACVVLPAARPAKA